MSLAEDVSCRRIKAWSADFFLIQTIYRTSAVSLALLCEGEVIVQGDEGPVCGVAQVVDCHGVTVGHQEREDEEEQQEEVEGDGEKLKEHCACAWMG